MQVSIVGIALIVIGLVAILAIVTQSVFPGVVVVPLLGVLFLALGLAPGQHGWLFPGSILTGLGLGVLISQEWLSGSAGTVQGSLPVIGLGLGFLAITPLYWYVAREHLTWPMIPGAILLIIGIGVLFGGSVWGEIAAPLALVAAGCYLLFWRATHHASHPMRERRERHRVLDRDRQ